MQKVSVTVLALIRQNEAKNLEPFMDRFEAEAIKTKSHSDDVLFILLITGLSQYFDF